MRSRRREPYPKAPSPHSHPEPNSHLLHQGQAQNMIICAENVITGSLAQNMIAYDTVSDVVECDVTFANKVDALNCSFYR